LRQGTILRWLKALGSRTDKIEYFKKSTVAPTASMNAVNIEDEESECEIKLWLNSTDKTAYYYTEPEKVYLNTNSSKMFDLEYSDQKVKNILELDLSNFDTSKVTDMSFMFIDMTNLTTLDLSSFDTSNVWDMNNMFAGMFSLTTLNLSSFDTSKVGDMQNMFGHMRSLTTLDLSNFDTSKVENMNSMFAGMSSLTTLDLSNFDTSKVTDMGYMFYLEDKDMSKDKLETIYVNNDFNTDRPMAFSGMFKNRKKLRGGNGSYLADPSTANKTWLRVDRPGVKGYFTRKS